MISLAYAALWLFIFSVPWEGVVRFEGMAVVSRLTGGLALAAALVAVVVSGRFRRWHSFHVASLLFVLWAGSGVLIMRMQGIPNKLWTFIQLLLVVWIIWELAPSRQRVLGLMTAYVFGAYVAALDTMLVYRKQAATMRRFAAGDSDPNDLAMTLALALPIAWYLGMTYHRPLLRWICRAYLPVGVIALGLTASRGGMLATMVALLIIPITMTKLTPGRRAIAIALLCISGALAVAYVPEKVVSRLATTRSEVEDADLGGRFKLWRAGIHAFTKKPIVGYGTSAFIKAITPELGRASLVAHNSFVSVLVEEGAVGLLLYLTMFATVFFAVLRLPPLERRFALVQLATLGVAMLPLTWEDRKTVWFVLAILVGLSQVGIPGMGGPVWQPSPSRVVPIARPPRTSRSPRPLTAPGRTVERDATR